MSRCVSLNCSLCTANGAEIITGVTVKGRYCTLIITEFVVADSPAILIRNAGLEDHLLGDCFFIFLVGQVTLVVHFAQDIHLAVTVTTCTVPLFALVHIDALGIRVEQRRIIGNADQTCTLSRCQILQFFAEIFCCGTLNTVAAPAQVNSVQVLFNDDILIIFLFADLGAENFHDLTLDRNTLLFSSVLYQLLCNGRTAELIVTAEEHVQTGFNSCDPVNTLVLVKTLVLNGNSSIDQRLGNIIQSCPLAVDISIDLLQLLDIAAVIYIIHKRSFFQHVIIQRPVGSLRQNIILKIVAKSTDKNDTTDKNDHQNRCSCTDRNFQYRKSQRNHGINQLQRPVGIPLLARFLCSPSDFLFIFHRIITSNTIAKCQRYPKIKSACALRNTSRIIIAYPF